MFFFSKNQVLKIICPTERIQLNPLYQSFLYISHVASSPALEQKNHKGSIRRKKINWAWLKISLIVKIQSQTREFFLKGRTEGRFCQICLFGFQLMTGEKIIDRNLTKRQEKSWLETLNPVEAGSLFAHVMT